MSLKSDSADWARKELAKATNDLAQSRNQVHNEITTLSFSLQQVTQDLEATQAKALSLQSAYDKITVRLEESTRKKEELQLKLAEQEGAFSSEMSTQQRLNVLMEQAKESAEKRMAEIEEQWESILEQHREREAVLHSEILQGKTLLEEMDHEKQELQLALDRLAESVGIETTNGNGHSSYPIGQEDESFAVRASTPSRSFMSLSGAPTLMSPTAALASRVQKSGKSFTQVYAELARTQEELRRERLESNRIGGVLEQVMADLQERGPALVAQREECEQMSQDLKEMSTTLARACEERDSSEREAKMRKLESEATLRENRILNQQITDLAKQVRDLSREMVLRDDPGAAARLEDDGSMVEIGDDISISDTQTVISTQLVTFKSLTDLVTQNGRLLRIVRELGTKMEAEEQDYRAKLQQGENEAVAEAKELISRLQEEIKAERSRLEGIRRERDMFRSMCASGSLGNQAQAAQVSAVGGQEMNAAHGILTNQYNQLQSQFEAFRSEIAKDTERLKEEAYQARSEASRNALTAAKEKSARESIEERLLNAQQTHQMAKSELVELQKRFSSLQENLMKQEYASHRLSQDLMTAHSKEESLRNEISNLKDERNLHQNIAERLTEEKKSNATEKANLSELLRNVQSMQAELERSSGEVRRRLELQSERLEEQCKELRSRLVREEEGHRQTSMRREMESTDLKIKLDKANEDLSKAKEELAVAKNSVQHLTFQTEDLQKQINSKEEKLAVYERRADGATSSGDPSGTLDREQRLQVEIAELKGELGGVQTEAEQARGHVEQFKAIASANEEALSQLQVAYDQYKSLTDSSLAEKTTELNSMKERMEAIGNELTSAQHEASTARQELEVQSNLWKQEKKTMEDAMTELGGIEDRARSAQELARDEVRAQIKLTQEAHSKYEAEIVAHAEDVKALVLVKQNLEAARSQAIEATKAMETAQGNLASSKDSWEKQKVTYQRDVEEMKARNDELQEHNNKLHEHLEALQSQTNEIRQAANASTADIGDASFSQSGNQELHEVIKYLRREKKIVDLQVEVREQECARLRQSVEHMQRSLDETRMQLSKEREQNAGASVSAKQHEELMEKINQLSILRESNITLRDETEKSLRKVQLLESQVESLTMELMPLREELRIKRVELEASENQLRLSQEDNKRWQGRTQSILQQYNRIDPEDLKKLQEKKEEAEKEVEEQKRLLKEKEAEVEAARAEVLNKQNQFDRLRAQSIDRLKSLKSELDGQQNEKSQAQARVESLEAEKAELTSKVMDMEAQLQQQKIVDASTTESLPAVSEASSQEAIRVAVEEAQKTWDEEKKALEEKRQVIEKREQNHLQKAKEFNTQMRAAIKERDELKTQRTESEQKLREQWIQDHASEIEKAVNERAGVPDAASLVGNDETLTALRQRISELEIELERANARIKELEEGGGGGAAASNTMTSEVADLQQQHQAALQEQESRLSAQFIQRQKSAVEIAVNKAKAAAAAEANISGEASQDVEEQIQTRLKAFEDERQIQLNAALEAKEKELRGAYEEQLKARYEAGKEESTLRNKLILKSKDNKIEKLTNELNALKGVAGIPSGPSVLNDPTASIQRPTPARPIPPLGTNIQPGPARGGPGNKGPGPARGTVRPQGGVAGGNVQKRKLEGGQSTSPGSPSAAAAVVASNGANEGGGLPKRPRPAGGQISIRGGASAGNRGGRGGHT